MGRTATITVEFAKPARLHPTIDLLLEAGWTPGATECLYYLPLHDNGDYDFQSIDSSQFETLLPLFEQQEALGEEVGFGIKWRGESGGPLLFRPDGSLKLVTMYAPIRLEKLSFCMDFSWYLERLLPPLVAADYWPEAIICLDAD